MQFISQPIQYWKIKLKKESIKKLNDQKQKKNKKHIQLVGKLVKLVNW